MSTSFDVEVLGRAAKQLEGLFGGNALPVHQNSLGLADDVAGVDCLVQFEVVQVGEFGATRVSQSERAP